MFQLQASGKRGLGDLELLRRGLFGREPVLELVARLRERAREPVVWIADHPAEELGGDSDGAELGGRAGRAAQVLRRARGEHAAHGRADQERADDVRTAALVLLAAALAVLVAADRDVLGAVVRSDLRAPNRERGR